MRRRILPAVLTLLSLMVDTSVIPFLIESPYIVSLTFITVLVIGVHLDRMHGMLYGLIAGLLQDILVGYQLGFNTFVYIILGFLAGLIAYEPEDVRARRRPSRSTCAAPSPSRHDARARIGHLRLSVFGTAASRASTFSTYSSARSHRRLVHAARPPRVAHRAGQGSALPAHIRQTGGEILLRP